MKRELEDKLKENFPTIFCDMYNSTPMESCMSCGICAGDGWYDIIHNMCEKIMALDPQSGFKAEQVKEKFGELRFYYSGLIYGPDKILTSESKVISRLVGDAEIESRKTCESCGSKENVTCEGRPNWIRSLCVKCAT